MGKYIRPLGAGPTTLIDGDLDNGYFGKATGIITGSELIELTGVSGTLSVTGDITWLKFKANGKTLLVADRNIAVSITWDSLKDAGCVRGERLINIDGINYACRLLTGANEIASTSGGGEWNKTIVKFTPDTKDSNWEGVYSWCQEVDANNGTKRILRGYTSSGYGSNTTTYKSTIYGWRPVLEVLF